MKSLPLTILLAYSLSLFSLSSWAAKKDSVIAVVNGRKIFQSDFLKAYRQNKLFVSNKVVTKKKVLDDLIARIIGVQKAQKNRLDRDPTVVEKMEDILYHAQISKDLEREFKKIKVSDLDVKNYYNQNQEYRTAQILLRVKVDASKRNTSKILKVAQEIYHKVKAEPDRFGEFANRYTQTGNAKTGGDMGFQPPVRYAPEYFAAIKQKKPGYISPPVKTQYGFHIIKILGVKKFKNINLGMYKKIVYDRKRDAILQAYFKKLRSSAKVTLNQKAINSF